MPEIEHNAPRFHYRVFWRRDIPGEQWNSDDILDWRKSDFVIPNQPTFQPYRIKVIAINEKGESNVAPTEVVGYSGEDGEWQFVSEHLTRVVIYGTKRKSTNNTIMFSKLIKAGL